MTVEADFVPDDRYLPNLTAEDVTNLPSAATVVLPIASIEQHGPHLPLSTDVLVGQILLGAALKQLARDVPVWALAPVVYGRSNEHKGFAGTMTVGTITLYTVLMEIAESVKLSGISKLVLWNSHGGNRPVVDAVSRDIREKYGLTVFVIHAGFAFRCYPVSAREQAEGIHAGDVETAILLAACPSLVKLSRAEAEYPRISGPADGGIGYHLEGGRGSATIAWVTSDLSKSGVLGDPSTATAANGEIAIREGSRVLAELLEKAARWSPEMGMDGSGA